MRRGAPLLIALVTCSAVSAQPMTGKSPFTSGAINTLDSVGINSEPIKGHALFYIGGGASNGSITLVPPPGSDQEKLKQEMEGFLPGFPHGVVKKHPSGALSLSWKSAHLGLMESEAKLPLVSLGRWMKERGGQSTFVLATGIHVTETPSLSPDHRSRTSDVFVLRNPESDVALSASISPLLVVGLAAFFLWPPLALGVSILLSRRELLRTDLKRSERRRAYLKRIFIGLGATILPHLPLAFFFILVGGINVFKDLWLGGQGASIYVTALMILPLMPSILGLPSIIALERKHLGPSGEALALVSAKIPSFEAVIPQVRKIQAMRFWSPFAGFLFMLAVFPLLQSDRLGWKWGVPLILLAVAGVISPHLIKDPRQGAAFPDLEPLQALANRLAEEIGLTAPKIVPEFRQSNERFCPPSEDGKFLAVNPIFVQSFSSEEQEFLLTIRLLESKREQVSPFAATVTALLMIGLGLLLGTSSRELNFLFAPILAMAPIAAVMIHTRSTRKRLPDSDIEAAAMTENIEAAISAKRKVRRFSGFDDPETEEKFQKDLDEFSAKVRQRLMKRDLG